MPLMTTPQFGKLFNPGIPGTARFFRQSFSHILVMTEMETPTGHADNILYSLHYVRDDALMSTSVRAAKPLYPRGPRSGPGYSVPVHQRLFGPIRSTRGLHPDFTAWRLTPDAFAVHIRIDCAYASFTELGHDAIVGDGSWGAHRGEFSNGITVACVRGGLGISHTGTRKLRQWTETGFIPANNEPRYFITQSTLCWND
jgi:hypothetical protein